MPCVKRSCGGTTRRAGGEVNDFMFEVGDKVQKCTGDYHLEGVVVAVFRTMAGKERYVVEHAPVAPGMLHIYSAQNLRKL